MQTVLLFVHLVIAMGLVGLVLMQRSEGGALGMGGGGSNALMSGRGAADVLARGTMIAAGLFFTTSLTLAVVASGSNVRKSVVETAPIERTSTPIAPPTAPVRAGPLPEPAPVVAPQPAAPAQSAAVKPAPATPAVAPATPAPTAAATAVKVAPAPTAESPRATPAPTPAATAPANPLPGPKPAEAAPVKTEPKPRAGPDE